MAHPLDDLAPMVAKWIAPYIRDELRNLERGSTPNDRYDATTCRLYVETLGTGVLNKAMVFFRLLSSNGQVGSVELTQALSLGTPRNLPSAMTNSLKQRAAALGIDRPWLEGVSNDDRTVWIDRDGIASRMFEALQSENHRRHAGVRTQN
jgi:hypothetical protein